jgi:hypothetical protein
LFVSLTVTMQPGQDNSLWLTASLIGICIEAGVSAPLCTLVEVIGSALYARFLLEKHAELAVTHDSSILVIKEDATFDDDMHDRVAVDDFVAWLMDAYVWLPDELSNVRYAGAPLQIMGRRGRFSKRMPKSSAFNVISNLVVSNLGENMLAVSRDPLPLYRETPSVADQVCFNSAPTVDMTLYRNARSPFIVFSDPDNMVAVCEASLNLNNHVDMLQANLKLLNSGCHPGVRNRPGTSTVGTGRSRSGSGRGDWDDEPAAVMPEELSDDFLLSLECQKMWQDVLAVRRVCRQRFLTTVARVAGCSCVLSGSTAWKF